jgi:hypothetical protein
MGPIRSPIKRLPGVKRSRRVDDRPPPSTRGAIPPFPQMSSWHSA